MSRCKACESELPVDFCAECHMKERFQFTWHLRDDMGRKIHERTKPDVAFCRLELTEAAMTRIGVPRARAFEEERLGHGDRRSSATQTTTINDGAE